MNLIPAVLLISTLAAAPEVELRTLAGVTQAGTLKELSAQRVVVATDSGDQTVATKDLLGVTLRGETSKAGKPQVWVELIDGTRLIGLDYAVKEGRAQVKLLDGGESAFSTALVNSVRLKEQNEAIARQWAEIVAMKRAADVIIVRREEAIDFLEGVLGEVSAETVQFTLDGDTVNVKRPRVEGFLYFHAKTAELPAAACQVVLHNGGRISAARVELKEDMLAVATPAGVELTQPLAAVKELDFSSGKLKYVSDLEWEGLDRQDYFAISGSKPDANFEPRKDTSFLGPLRLAGKTYAKGLAIKSRTKLTYRLPGKFSRLVGLAGINGSMAPQGNVRLTIRGDERMAPLLETTIAGDAAPQEIAIDLTDVRRLTIEVDYGEDGDVGDHLNLCDLRIIQ